MVGRGQSSFYSGPLKTRQTEREVVPGGGIQEGGAWEKGLGPGKTTGTPGSQEQVAQAARGQVSGVQGSLAEI